MAKIALNTITTVKKVEPKIITFKEHSIEVIQYLPVNEKLAMIERILNNALDDTGFFNPVRLEIYTMIEVVRTYTNISITDKMMENPTKLYDTLAINDILTMVIKAIPEEEYNAVFEAIEECAEHTVKYFNSFAGVMKTITTDYDATKMNVDELTAQLADKEQIGFVKEILEKLG